MAFTTQLDWQRATVTTDRISVPLGGNPDDDWLDRFQDARLDAKRVRVLGNLPHLQIELRDGEVAATGIRDGDHDGAKRLLTALVDTANQPGRRRSRPNARGGAAG
ncbi:MAG TPA: hypothetical protein VID68_00230 [Solirubrobacteraceae bacterium]|jgi:hypothetical protein